MVRSDRTSRLAHFRDMICRVAVTVFSGEHSLAKQVRAGEMGSRRLVISAVHLRASTPAHQSSLNA
jgi:hypothetical protein